MNVVINTQDADVNARPIVRADCIKFVHTFRNQFSVEQLLALMPMLIAHLQSEHVSPSVLLIIPSESMPFGLDWIRFDSIRFDSIAVRPSIPFRFFFFFFRFAFCRVLALDQKWIM